METHGYYVPDSSGNRSSRDAVNALVHGGVTPQNSTPQQIADELNRIGAAGAVTIICNGNVIVGNRLGNRFYGSHRVLMADLGN